MVFALRLHIQPSEMERMYFYDIMMLYNKYADYIEKENERQEKEQAKYEDEHADMMRDMSSIKNSMPNYNSFNPSNFNPSGFNPGNYNF